MMRLFKQLFDELDTTTRTGEKVRALERDFAAAEPRDAAWALFFLIGRKIKRVINSRLLRDWLATEAGLPAWIVDESYHAVGDFAETLALLLPDRHTAAAHLQETATPARGLLFSDDELLAASMPRRLRNLAGNMGCAPGAPLPTPVQHSSDGASHNISLHQLVEERIVPLAGMPPPAQRAVVVRTWRELDARERFIWHKLLFGEFRVGVAQTLVSACAGERRRSSAGNHGTPLDGSLGTDRGRLRLAHSPNVAANRSGSALSVLPCAPAGRRSAGPRQPRRLASRVEMGRHSRQLIRRQGQLLVWSRGEELVTDRFPEVAAAGKAIGDGTVIDGEIVAWRDERPLPFSALQTRIGRIKLSPKVLAEAPVVFMAFDVLELEGVDMRTRPLAERRETRRACQSLAAQHRATGFAACAGDIVG